MHKNRTSRVFVGNLLSRSTKKLCRRYLLCFKHNLVSKVFMHRRGGASWLCRNFFVSVPNIFRLGTFKYFRKFLVSKNFMHKKGISLFSLEIFLSHITNKSVGKPFNVSENFGYRKFICIRKWITLFDLKNILLHRNEKHRHWSFLCFSKYLVRKKLCIRDKGRGGRLSRFCVEKILSHSAKKFVGENFNASEK